MLIAPPLPWGWLGGPPSLNRLLGLRWQAEARTFHRLFYGVTPSDAQLAALVEGAN